MPATATGRGAQVVLDPSSATAQAVRGAYGATMEANRAKVAADVLAGVISDGNRPDGTTGTGGVATDVAVNPTSGPSTFNGGISLGAQTVAVYNDFSKHIALYTGADGFSVLNNGLAHVSSNSHVFYAANANIGFMDSTGLNNMAVGVGYPQSGTFTQVMVGSTSGPTWTTGSAAPSSVQPVGSLYSRVGGAVGATLYVSRGAGTWAAVASV